MGNKIKIFAIFCLPVLFLACELDFSGFIRSTDRVEKRFSQSMEYNLSHPYQNIVSVTDEYSFLIASDLHVGETKNTLELFNYYESSNDLAMVLAGDLVSGKREDYEVFKTLIDSIEKPTFKITGNHDLYFDGWKSFYEFFGSSTYYFTVTTPSGIDLYICLDSGGGTFGKSQMEWLEKLLVDSRNNYRYCTVISHVNMLRTRRTSSTNPLVDEVSYLVNLFAEHKVNLVVNGHDHVQDAVILGNTTYLITDAVVDSYENAGYIAIRADTTKLSYEFVRF